METCTIISRFVLGTLALTLGACANRGASTVYFSTIGRVSDRTIQYLPVEGGKPKLLEKWLAGSLAFDPCEPALAYGHHGIGVRSLDGGENRGLASSVSVNGMMVDAASGHLYWVNDEMPGNQDAIERANLKDGTDRKLLVQMPQSIFDLAADPKRNQLYWTYNDSVAGRPRGIWRSKLDGSERELLPLTGGELRKQLTVDSVRGDLYWSIGPAGPRKTSEIWMAHADGSGEHSVIRDRLSNIDDLAIDSRSRKLYWAERESGTAPDRLARIQRSNLDGTEVETLWEVRDRYLFAKALALGFAPREKSWSKTLARCGCPSGKGK